MKYPKNKSLYSTHQFTWIPFYQELAKELVHWENRQDELIAFLETLRKDGHVITPLNDKDKNGSRFLLKKLTLSHFLVFLTDKLDLTNASIFFLA